MALIPPPSSLSPGAMVDAYVRDSGGSRQEQSTDQQLGEIEAYCREHGLQLRRKFADVAKSGGSTATRDEFNRMIDLTRRPDDRPKGLLLWNYARFARDIDDAIYYKALLRNRDIVVHSLTDPVPEGQYGRIIEFFIDVSNEEKRRQTSTDSRRGLRDLVTKHGCVPGTPPRGFKRERVELGTHRDGSARIAHRWIPDPDLVPRVLQAFQMRAAGNSLAQIHEATHLYSSLNSYQTFFTNKLYIGTLEFGDLVVEHYCDPLIDLATWNLVQARIDEHRQRHYSRVHPRRVHSPYLLSGMIFCSLCGSPMHGNTVSGKARGRNEAYICSRAKRHAGCTARRISKPRLEQAVIETLKRYILLPESLTAMLEMESGAQDRREQQRTQRLQELRADRTRLSTQIARLTRAIAERGHSQALLDKLGELEAQRAQALAETSELEHLTFPELPPLTAAQIAALSDRMNAAIKSAPVETVRPILQNFIYRVVVEKHGNEISGTITYFYPGAPPFELPPAEHRGGSLSMDRLSSGPPVYRQTFSHPFSIPARKKKST